MAPLLDERSAVAPDAVPHPWRRRPGLLDDSVIANKLRWRGRRSRHLLDRRLGQTAHFFHRDIEQCRDLLGGHPPVQPFSNELALRQILALFDALFDA